MKKLVVIAMLIGLVMPVFAGEDEEKARAIYEKHQQAVVTVQLVIKQKMSFAGMGDNDNESKAEITGTVIGPEGLTVVALSQTDPTAMFSNFMPEEMAGDFKMESSISDVKILLEDGKEVDASVVLRDKDLDLAYVRPKVKPETPFVFVDLKEGGTAGLLDRVVTINRMGKVANRTASLSFETIEAIVSKPRTFYFPGDSATLTGTGSPAFTLDGRLLGVLVTRTISSKGGGDFDPGRSHASVILPAADVLEGAMQAPPFGEEPKSEPVPAEKEQNAEPAN